jgi:O-antigen ligase
MLLQGRAPRWLLCVTIALVALLWLSAFFVLRDARATGFAAPETGAASGFCPPGAGGETWRPLVGSVGVNFSDSELAEPALSRALDILVQGKVRWVRLMLPWDRLEPARGSFDWGWSDQVFAALDRHPEIEPLVVLDRSPEWARAAPDANNVSAPPQERADFGAFAAEVAKRYGAQVRYYQVWNEPNVAPHWGARPVDPADYLGLLREAALQIRAGDPGAQVILGALAPTVEGGGANLSDIAYLDALYHLNARPWFDAVASQPFGFSQAAAAPPAADRLNFGRAALLRDVMIRHGDSCAPLWATRFGWNALPADAEGASSPWGQVSEAEQAAGLRDAVEIAASSGAGIGPLFWAAFCPPGDDPAIGFSLCGEGSDLAKGTFQPRPAWGALLDAVSRPPVLFAGDHPVSDPALHYAGGWRVTPGAADPGRDASNLLSFEFYGTDLSLRVQGGPYWALFRIWVDDRPANALPRDESGAAYLVLHDPLSEIRSIPVAAGLPTGQHSVRLQSQGGWGQWPLQGLSVGDSAGAARWPGWLLLGLAVSGSAFLGVLWWSRRPAPAETGASRNGVGLQALNVGPMRLSRIGLDQGRWLWVGAIALALVLALSPWLLVDLVALAGLGVLFVVRPDLSLPLIAASIPFWPRPKHLLRWEFSLFEMLVWLAAAALIARWVLAALSAALERRNDQRSKGESSPFAIHFGGLDWPVMALLGLGLLSTITAQRSDVALREYRTVFLGGALFYWLITRVPAPDSRKGFSPRPLVHGLVAGAAVVSLVGLWQLATGLGRVDVEGVWRVRAFYGSPNNLALLLDRVIPLALAVAAFGGIAGSERPAGGPTRTTLRWLYVAATLVMFLACAATFSKGALLLGLPVGVALVLGLGAWRIRRRWPWLLLAGLAVAGIAGLAWVGRTPRFADLVNLTAGTSFLRVKLWQGAWHMALDHPWLGVGPDNFLYAYRTRYVLPSAWQELNLNHPHDLFLDLWTRLGIPGLIVGVWAIWAGARRAWALSRDPDEAIWPIGLGLLGGLAAMVAHGLIDNSLFLVDLMAIFMLSLGLLQRLSMRRE